MFRSERLLTDLKRSLEERLRLGELAAAQQQQAKRVVTAQVVWVATEGFPVIFFGLPRSVAILFQVLPRQKESLGGG